jgi:hypothetical protein
VTQSKNPPVLRAKAERVLQTLKHDVAILGAIPVPAQRGERERVRGAVAEGEAIFKRKVGLARVVKVRAPQAH